MSLMIFSVNSSNYCAEVSWVGKWGILFYPCVSICVSVRP